MPASAARAASGICVMLSNSHPAEANEALSALVEKRGPWITTTVPPSWTVRAVDPGECEGRHVRPIRHERRRELVIPAVPGDECHLDPADRADHRGRRRL